MNTSAPALDPLALADLARQNRPDDDAQDVLLSALLRPPVTHTSLGAWFQGALHRRGLQTARAEGSRRARERRASRPEGTWDETLERNEKRDVLAAGLALLEPESRRILRARYWDGLSLTAIADRRGCSLGSVKRRHAAALESLRANLGDPSIQRRDWAGLVWLLGGLTALALACGLSVAALGRGSEPIPASEVGAPSTTVAMMELVPAVRVASFGVSARQDSIPAVRLLPSEPIPPALPATHALESVPMRRLIPATPTEPAKIRPFELPFDATTSIAMLD